jgi:hypothetical protein
MKTRFKIEGMRDENEMLFWSNEYGWVGWNDADSFEESINLPIGATRIILVDENNHTL